MATITARVVELERELANVKSVQAVHEKRLNRHGSVLIEPASRKTEQTVANEVMRNEIESLRARLEALEGKTEEQRPSPSPEMVVQTQFDDFKKTLHDYFAQGKIGAVKAVRMVCGVGVAQAKEMVDSWSQSRGETFIETRSAVYEPGSSG